MESKDKNNGGEEQQQLRRSARKCKFNEFANDGQTGEAEEEQQEPAENLSKNNLGQQGNDDSEVCTRGPNIRTLK
jgi:hypothetical protein